MENEEEDVSSETHSLSSFFFRLRRPLLFLQHRHSDEENSGKRHILYKYACHSGASSYHLQYYKQPDEERLANGEGSYAQVQRALMHSSLAAAWRGLRLSVEIHAAPCILDGGFPERYLRTKEGWWVGFDRLVLGCIEAK